MKKSTLKCFSIIFTLSVVFSRLIYAADTNQQALANTSDKGVELINASGATNVEKVRALLTQGADPNTVADGKTPFLMADVKTRVDQLLSQDQVAILNILVATALSGIENAPTLNNIRDAISHTLLDENPQMKFVASRLVQVYPDPSLGKSILVRCDAVVYDEVAGYQLLSASGMGFETPPGAYTWLTLAGAEHTNIRLRQDSKGKWKGSIVRGLSFADLRNLHALKISPEAYKAELVAGVPALITAIFAADDNMACKLLDAAPTPLPEQLQAVAFVSSASYSCPNAMAKLLERGTDINVTATRADSATALCMAAQACNTRIIKFLLEKGANPNKAKNGGITPLMMAAVVGDNETADLLIKKGADVNAASEKDGWSALHFAVDRGWLSVVNVLCNAKADVNAPAKDGNTPLKLAEKGGFSDIAAVLRQAGAK